MLFTTFPFLAFFATVVVLFYALPSTRRGVMLLLASCLFYMCWRPAYILLLLATTGINFAAALRMEAAPTSRSRQGWFWMGVASSLALLFFFKYYNFVNDSLRTVFVYATWHDPLPDFHVLLPIGISFYTFMTLSYTIDVYNRRVAAERHFGVFLLYIAFFPQVLAGPIGRAGALLPQIRNCASIAFDSRRVTQGLALMLMGFFRKLVIADRLAPIVSKVYGDPRACDGLTLILATLAFTLQIYCDFAGYSEIALGAAKVLGIDLIDNFRRPYLATSLTEFWHRWHISLSTWFRDYVYIPLGGNRVGRWRMYRNLMVAFVASGLWHGANWTFVVWGGVHGIGLVLERVTQGIRQRVGRTFERLHLGALHTSLASGLTFLVASVLWVFFRANTLADAWYVVTHFQTGWAKALGPASLHDRAGRLVNQLGILYVDALLIGVAIVILVAIEAQEELRGKRLFEWLADRPASLRWGIAYLLLLFTLLFGVSGVTEFVYFKF